MCNNTKEMLIAMGCIEASNDQTLIDALNKYCEQYEINTCLRIAHFLSQCAHESTSFTNFGEGTNFSLDNAPNAQNLLEVYFVQWHDKLCQYFVSETSRSFVLML